MNAISQILHEIIRVQALVFISHASPMNPPTPRELSRWLRLPSEATEEVIGELVAEGFVDPLPELRFPVEQALHLTPIGEGWLRWMRDQAQNEEE